MKAAFAGAAILRPSIIFGREDQFLNRFADLIRLAPVVPVVSGETKFQPVYVVDVAKAIAKAALDPAAYAGKTYELGGAETLSMLEINQKIASMTGRDRSFVPVPAMAAKLLSLVPGGPMTGDQLKMLAKDNVASDAMPGLEAFGVNPTPMAAVADRWLVQYRRHGRFAATA